MSMSSLFPTVITREFAQRPFDIQRIENAITKASVSTVPTKLTPAELARKVHREILRQYPQSIYIEEIQDIVERVLMQEGETEVARHYILYRAEHAAQRERRDVPAEVRAAFDESAKYFPTAIQQFQFFDKYSRYDDKLGRRETWVETVDRTVSFLRELVDDQVDRTKHTEKPASGLDEQTWHEIRQGILEMRVMPSMRLLAMAGPAARRQNLSLYNCSAVGVDSLDTFVEALLISMAGCGVGFSVERRFVDKLPTIAHSTIAKNEEAVVYYEGASDNWPVYSVEDTTEGWADALRIGLETWFSGQDVSFDFSLVRPAGSVLKTKGGRASGPEPLRKLLQEIRWIIIRRRGQKLRPIDAHDIMCHVGSAAVSGGTRRTAMISLFDHDDYEMLHAKDGDLTKQPQRWNANNSAVWPERGISQRELLEQMLSMDKAGTGEPGIFNRKALQMTQPKHRETRDFLTNPCVTGDTWVLTDNGARQVHELIGKQFNARVSGKDYSTTEDGFWSTGVKPIYEVRTSEGHSIKLTDNHPLLVIAEQDRYSMQTEWREVKDIKPGDKIKLGMNVGKTWSGEGNFDEGYILGQLVGDGTFSRKIGKMGQTLTLAHLNFWGDYRDAMAERVFGMVKQNVKTRSDITVAECWQPDKLRISSADVARLASNFGIEGDKFVGPKVERASSEFYRGFLSGFFDSDGSVQGEQAKGVSIRLSQSNLERLQTVQRMLLRMGIASKIYQNRRPAGWRELPDGNGGKKPYFCQANHELIISGTNMAFFYVTVGFQQEDKSTKLREALDSYNRTLNGERYQATVTEIVPMGEAEVYDCSVPGPNCFDANGFIAHNCGEIVLRPDGGLCNLSICVARPEDTYETLAEKVRLATIIGTIQSLAVKFPGMRPIWRKNAEEERLLGVDITGQRDCEATADPIVMGALRGVVYDTNLEMAELFGIRQSASTTCVKPSGNSSVLLNSSSGIHARWAPYYVRNVRVGTKSPIYQVLKDAGVPMQPEVGQTAENAITWVASFPVKSPEGAITRNDLSALEQCYYWLHNKKNWTTHNPSVTITYRPDELLDVISWVWKNRDVVGGMSFLPRDDAQYDLMPYQEISKETYEQMISVFPTIDFSKMYRYEQSDMSTASSELSCFAGQCEIA